jgi:hypothetical protein
MRERKVKFFPAISKCGKKDLTAGKYDKNSRMR